MEVQLHFQMLVTVGSNALGSPLKIHLWLSPEKCASQRMGSNVGGENAPFSCRLWCEYKPVRLAGPQPEERLVCTVKVEVSEELKVFTNWIYITSQYQEPNFISIRTQSTVTWTLCMRCRRLRGRKTFYSDIVHRIYQSWLSSLSIAVAQEVVPRIQRPRVRSPLGCPGANPASWGIWTAIDLRR